MISELDKALRAIADRLFSLPSPSRVDVDRVKIEVSREHSLSGIPGNSEVISVLKPCEVERLLPLLRRKETRAASGVNVVAVMTEPRECPHGRCAYCPGGPGEDVPQSYTGHEPASMRGAQNDYDPYMQVDSRIRQLEAIGHDVDKVDLIIMGGTFPASPWEYQRSFVKGCLDAMLSAETRTLDEAKVYAETASIRNVGITVETRPDCVDREAVDRLLELGVTRVELGVQNVYDDIYELVERGHTVEDVKEATRILRDSGLKVCYHMMPGLPGSSQERDLEGFRTIFEDPLFRPDMLKIYPTLVVKGTKLHEWWTSGNYTPLSTGEAVSLIAGMKNLVPSWVRIMRVQRDIPAHIIEAGVDKGNLRQLIHKYMEDSGSRCSCIRCREVGHRDERPDPDGLSLVQRSYDASGGTEVFLSFEDPESDVLVAFLRLRMPEGAHRTEFGASSAVVRELHVYGRMVPVGEERLDGWQHRGWGRRLMGEAERVASEDYGATKMLVMSALGTKEYYAGLGYRKDGAYVSKHL